MSSRACCLIALLPRGALRTPSRRPVPEPTVSRGVFSELPPHRIFIFALKGRAVQHLFRQPFFRSFLAVGHSNGIVDPFLKTGQGLIRRPKLIHPTPCPFHLHARHRYGPSSKSSSRPFASNFPPPPPPTPRAAPAKPPNRGSATFRPSPYFVCEKSIESVSKLAELSFLSTPPRQSPVSVSHTFPLGALSRSGGIILTVLVRPKAPRTRGLSCQGSSAFSEGDPSAFPSPSPSSRQTKQIAVQHQQRPVRSRFTLNRSPRLCRLPLLRRFGSLAACSD